MHNHRSKFGKVKENKNNAGDTAFTCTVVFNVPIFSPTQPLKKVRQQKTKASKNNGLATMAGAHCCQAVSATRMKICICYIHFV